MSTAKFDPHLSVPAEILEAQQRVVDWMKEQGHEAWSLLGVGPEKLHAGARGGGKSVTELPSTWDTLGKSPAGWWWCGVVGHEPYADGAHVQFVLPWYHPAFPICSKCQEQLRHA